MSLSRYAKQSLPAWFVLRVEVDSATNCSFGWYLETYIKKFQRTLKRKSQGDLTFSELIFSGSVMMHRYPLMAHARARPMPVFPDVGSIKVSPGWTATAAATPSSIISKTIKTARRHQRRGQEPTQRQRGITNGWYQQHANASSSSSSSRTITNRLEVHTRGRAKTHACRRRVALATANPTNGYYRLGGGVTNLSLLGASA